ncbi:hypothetical protein CEXT_603971 [Caerostris extrusa]|uniref:Uncharacterized protein n=1 Tax=Caerostris extrusa TaxID=172846 RepID=A0AAV4SVH8_CAEEX|nr:hypothetical protein CEXT_603971 [Caerostris extrusa]
MDLECPSPVHTWNSICRVFIWLHHLRHQQGGISSTFESTVRICLAKLSFALAFSDYFETATLDRSFVFVFWPHGVKSLPGATGCSKNVHKKSVRCPAFPVTSPKRYRWLLMRIGLKRE